MKVTFTCEKCGHEFPIEDVIKDSYGHDETHVWRVALNTPCHNCAKLTYGPLTEEMVAEALDEAWRLGGQVSQAPARFVLRLLSDGRFREPLPHYEGCTLDHMRDYWRGWLLDLARKP